MGGNMKEEIIDFDTTVEMDRAVFPLVQLKTGEHMVNLLHGYSSNLDANMVRESITPLDGEKSFDVLIDERESDVKKLRYEIRTVTQNEILDSGEVSALDIEDGYKKAQIRLGADLEQGREYSAKVTLITAEGRKIHYFTRIKQYSENYFLKEKMDFVMKFHEELMDKKKAKKLAQYLEPPNGSADNTSLAHVTIFSNLDTFSWGALKPEVLTEIIPSVKEINIETAVIELSYFVRADVGSGKEETYQVKEYFRVRYTPQRMYLLHYERTMEALFDIDLFSLVKSEIKLGISGDKDLELVTTLDNNKLCFVRQGALWYYNLAENQAVKVYSFMEENKPDYIREGYDQHDIRILNLSEEGNIDFLVYGYMNRGDYEGKVGIILYKFYARENRIEEQVYIPMGATYQMIKEDLKDFNYVNQKGVYFFAMVDGIYSYNIAARKLTQIAKDIKNENYIMPAGGNYIAWQDSSIAEEAHKVTIMDLETQERKEINAHPGDNIKILGSIDKNMIIGFARGEDISRMQDGTVMEPFYKVQIMDGSKNILKVYEEENRYVTDIKIENNVIKLDRVVKKKKNGKIYFGPAKPDNLINKETKEAEVIAITERVTDLAMTELYISLPPGFNIAAKPGVSDTVNTILSEDTTVHFDIEKREERYYVYAMGEVVKSYGNATDAILMAYEKMGVVWNQNCNIVWERGSKYNKNSIQGITPIYESAEIDSISACIAMVLKYNQVNGKIEDIVKEKGSVVEILKIWLKKDPVNLNGCTLDDVLYFVSSGRPVIAMKDTEHAVLINGYSESENYVDVLDPEEKMYKRISLAGAEAMFQDAGNIFISYIE